LHLENENDIFDLLREGSESITEQPSAQVWQKLERRLDTKKKKSRRLLSIQPSIVVATIALLLTMAIVAIVAARQQEERLRLDKQFSDLNSLKGDWKYVSKGGSQKIKEELLWGSQDDQILIGDRHVVMDGKIIAFSSWIISKGKRDIVCSMYQSTDSVSEKFVLKELVNHRVVFVSGGGKRLVFYLNSVGSIGWQLDGGEVFEYGR
jgi:hypothetical protein